MAAVKGKQDASGHIHPDSWPTLLWRAARVMGYAFCYLTCRYAGPYLASAGVYVKDAFTGSLSSRPLGVRQPVRSAWMC